MDSIKICSDLGPKIKAFAQTSHIKIYGNHANIVQ